MLKTSKLLRLHDEILNINSYKVTEHEDIATESTSKLGLSLHIQDDNNEKEKIINYSYLLNDHNKDSICIVLYNFSHDLSDVLNILFSKL